MVRATRVPSGGAAEYLRRFAQIAQSASVMNIDRDDETQAEDFEEDTEDEGGMLIGYELGTPAAFSGDCDLQPYDKKRPGSGCCAVIKCMCGQVFRIDLLANEYSRCPKCSSQYTSLLLVCQFDDDCILQAAFEHLVANNEALGNNPGAPEPEEDDVEDDAAEPAGDESAEPGK
jgi:hypothetical protein